jgi:hypothetical protein
MFHFEDEKSTSRYPIKHLSAAANPAPALAQAEWEFCHTREEAIKWHLKWTPWWTKDMVEGIVDKAYSDLEKKRIAKEKAQKVKEAAAANIDSQLKAEQAKLDYVEKTLIEMILADEAKARAIEDERRKKLAEEEAAKKLAEEEAAKKLAEEEAARKAQESKEIIFDPPTEKEIEQADQFFDKIIQDAIDNNKINILPNPTSLQ